MKRYSTAGDDHAMPSSHDAAGAVRATTRLWQLINRTGRVLSVLHPPNAACARIMEKAGCEVGFVGTGHVVGACTGLADVGALTMLECVTVATVASWPCAGWCANARDAGVSVVPLNQAIARYRAAVEMKNEIDPNFVVIAQCYARGASDSSFDDTLVRLKAYKEDAGVDWVQLESPHSVDEIKQARSVVDGPFMKGRMPRYLTLTNTCRSASTLLGFLASRTTCCGRRCGIS
jgi:2-methylisocitrate lyase-like PEP mutase family enzyme